MDSRNLGLSPPLAKKTPLNIIHMTYFYYSNSLRIELEASSDFDCVYVIEMMVLAVYAAVMGNDWVSSMP